MEAVDKTYIDQKYRAVHALQNISFSLLRHEFVSIIGPSGCGKSTLLRLASGLERATAGSVTYQGLEVTGPEPDRGLVFQAYNAFPWLTVRENISFGLQARGRHDGVEVSKWMQLMGLTDFADSYPKTLSGGMRQRLAIARAMIVKPQLLLLDEPFGALDERTRATMQQLLLSVVSQSGCTVLLVTHDIRESILLSDRIILLNARPGRIAKIVTSTLPKPRTRQLLKTPEFSFMYDSLLEAFHVDSHVDRIC